MFYNLEKQIKLNNAKIYFETNYADENEYDFMMADGGEKQFSIRKIRLGIAYGINQKINIRFVKEKLYYGKQKR